MAHRNRWFTWVYLLKMVIFHGYVSHNQMVYIYIYSTHKMVIFLGEFMALGLPHDSTVFNAIFAPMAWLKWRGQR